MELSTLLGFWSWGTTVTHTLDDTRLARWLGLYLTITTVLVLFRLGHVRGLADAFKKNAAFTALSGSLSLLLGTLLVAVHPQLEANWTVLISLIGYFSILKGVCRLFGNGLCSKFCSITAQSTTAIVIWSVIWLAVGLILLRHGYFA